MRRTLWNYKKELTFEPHRCETASKLPGPGKLLLQFLKQARSRQSHQYYWKGRTDWVFLKPNDREKPTLAVQWIIPREGRPQPTGSLREKWNNTYTFKNTLATFAVSSTSITNLNIKINGGVQATSMDPNLQSMELVPQGFVKLLRQGRSSSLPTLSSNSPYKMFQF